MQLSLRTTSLTAGQSAGRSTLMMTGALIAVLCLGTPAMGKQPKSLAAPQGPVILAISGNIGLSNANGEAHFDRAMLTALPQSSIATSTSVTEGVHQFAGVSLHDLLDAVTAEGTVLIARALNEYVAEIPITDIENYNVLAALQMDGEPLSPRDKGPIWIVYPRDDFQELQDIRFDYRWVWQLRHLEVR